MTCIAWDGKTLAADKRSMPGALHRTVTKIHRIKGALVGCSGNIDQAQEMFAWARGGFKPEEFPESQRDKDDWCAMLVIRKNGVFHFARTPYPHKHEDKQAAIGSGRDFALTAMYLGKSAADAIRIACEFDPNCGNGVDVLVLK